MATDAERPTFGELTQDQVSDIRRWRVTEGATWRGVAAEFCEKYGDPWAGPLGIGWGKGNQLLGIELCEWAARSLGEDPREAPWN